MYTQNFSSRGRSRFSPGSSSNSGGSRPSGGRRFGGYRGNRGGGGGRSRRSSERLDINKFISKAQPRIESEYTIENSFQDLNLDPTLLANILKKGYENPMPIQDQAMPYILEGKDLIGIANTGMGKTAAFLIPLINKTLKDKTNKTLIIAPTRELAEQIREELFDFSARLGIYSSLVIGGASIGKQISDLRRGQHFVIGTPGRLKDLNERRAIRFSDFHNIVLDEVDRMFDMGFSKDVTNIMNMLPKNRQSLFFSATITRDVENLINQNSINPVTVSVKFRETTANVDQNIVRVNYSDSKIDVLHDLLIKEEFTKTLIFGKTKMGVNRLSYELQQRGFKAESIHGDKSQSQRQRALFAFKSDRVNILVATDVAARGLDIPDVSHVINYELPETYSDYVHRIGRTGRGNKTGKALTFVS